MNKYLPEGMMTHAKGGKDTYSLGEIKAAHKSGKILESLVTLCDSEHNLHVNLGCMKGIIPRIHGALGIEDGSVRDIALISRVNKSVCFKIIGFENDAGETRAILSRRDVQQECKNEYIASLEQGQVIPARVTHLEKFGAFVDIGAGINALIPIDMISVSRISHPCERFDENEDILAVVRSIDNGRITLSQRELLGTWEENADMFRVGETVPGIIRSVESYGIFVELAPNLAGLAEYVPNIFPGQNASVYIKSISPEKMKIKLVIVNAFSAEKQRSEKKYFIRDGKIDNWRYSPEGCIKLIETKF